MENEMLKIFDENRDEIGMAAREEVHKVGHWHETFHCWFISEENGMELIYFQIRSDTKKDYPNLLDITAAGHILAHEAIYDGTREVREELGIDVSSNELVSLGVIKDRIIQEDFIDKELGNVFLYQYEGTMDDFNLQKEEVSGIVKADFNEFYEFCLGDKDDINVEGFEVSPAGEKVSIHKTVGKNSFVPHEYSYFERVAKLIRENINRIHSLRPFVCRLSK